MWIVYVMTNPGEADDSVRAQLDECDRICDQDKSREVRHFMDREAAKGFLDGGRPDLVDAIALARLHRRSQFVVGTLERLASDVISRTVIITQLLAAGVDSIHTAQKGVVDAFRAIRHGQDCILKRLSSVESLKQYVTKLESNERSLKESLTKSRAALQRRSEEILRLRKGPPSLANSLLIAIHASGVSVNAIAKAANVPQPVLHRFVSAERGISLKTADKVCSALGLRLSPPGAVAAQTEALP